MNAPAPRTAARLVMAAVLVLCASIFATSSRPDDPEARPRPPATRLAEHSPVIDPLASAAPLSRTATMRATTITGRTLNYCSNGSIDRPSLRVTRVIFVVHGNDRRACVVANAVLAAATPQQRATTLVVAPRFPTADDRVNPVTQLYWTFSSWSQGDPSANATNPLSSFEVLDELIDRLRKLQLVVAGFSGGGQLVARYSAGTVHEPIRFIISSPSSYLYWTPQRPGTANEQLAACPSYNDYRYGLERLNPYLSEVGTPLLARRFSERHVVYLIGGAETDPRSPSMDRTCGAMAQGSNRLERGVRYWAYLPSVFGPEVHTRHSQHVVPRVGHNPFGMFSAPPAKAALFD